MSKPDLDTIISRFDHATVLSSHQNCGDETIIIEKEKLLDVMRFIKNTLHYDFLVDVTAVDYLGQEPRFEVIYHLRSMKTGARLRVKAKVKEMKDASPPVIESIVSLWPSANWLEREVWDLYGIYFEHHPDLRRILMYEEFEGHPLRKDYPKEKRQPLSRRENLLPEQLEPAE